MLVSATANMDQRVAMLDDPCPMRTNLGTLNILIIQGVPLVRVGWIPLVLGGIPLVQGGGVTFRPRNMGP